LNYRILDAAIAVAGERDAEIFIHEIGSAIGYAKSDLYALSETTYKIRKIEVKRSIAKRLSLF
jgi:predicted metal-dependent TIM-barrel fold hydrolase